MVHCVQDHGGRYVVSSRGMRRGAGSGGTSRKRRGGEGGGRGRRKAYFIDMLIGARVRSTSWMSAEAGQGRAGWAVACCEQTGL